MKRSSSPSLRFLAAAANEATVTMSSRPPYRGGRNRQRRGYSDRSYSSGDGGRGRGEFFAGDSHSQSVSDVNRGFRPVDRPNFDSRSAYGYQPRPRPPRRGFSDQSSSSSGVVGGRGQFVTGDSHFQSVGEANRGYPPVERPNFDNRSAYVSQPRPPHFNPQPPSSSPPPPLYPPPHFNHNPPPHFNQTQLFRPQQQFRPRPSKPLDYRNWESAKLGPPPHCERFKVLSYNILADYLAFSHTSKLYFHIPRKMLAWEWRKRSIIFELGLWSADILCFQEVDKFQDLEEELKLQGYSGIWKMRTGDPVDGCAMFWRVSRFKLLHEECIEYNKLGLRDNVAQICVLESLKQDNKDISALPLGLAGCSKVVVCNIHVLYNPRRGEIKLGQIRVLLDRAHAVSKLWDDAPIVLCGDFNCTPKSPLYNYISERELNLSDLPRDKLSGQASAEIHPPRQFSPFIRAQPADSRDGASAVVGHGELRQRPQSGSPLDVQEQSSHPESNSVDLPSVDSLSQPHCGNTVLNLFGGQNSNKNGTSSLKMTEETLPEIDGCTDETRSSVSVPDGGLKGNTCSNLNETELTKETHQDTVDGCNDAFHAMVSVSGLEDSASRPQNQGEVSGPYRKDSLVDSHLEDVTEAEHEKKTNATQQSEPNLQTENDIMSCERSKLSFPGSTDSIDAITDPTLCSSNSGISSSELFHETSFPSTMKVSIMGSSGNFSSRSIANDKDNPSNLSEVNVSYELTSTEELSETNYKEESFGEDSTIFLSELHDGNEPFSSDFSHAVRSDESFREPATVPHSRDEALENGDRGMDSEPADALEFRYDPSAWTPMEIETATGNADCTLVEHPLMLRSTYAEVEDCSGTRDSNGEPLVTSYNRCFLGTVDYIWRSEGLQTVRVLAPIPKHAMQWTPGFPTKKWGSDHIALVSELAFVKDGSIHNTDDP